MNIGSNLNFSAPCTYPWLATLTAGQTREKSFLFCFVSQQLFPPSSSQAIKSNGTVYFFSHFVGLHSLCQAHAGELFEVYFGPLFTSPWRSIAHPLKMSYFDQQLDHPLCPSPSADDFMMGTTETHDKPTCTCGRMVDNARLLFI